MSDVSLRLRHRRQHEAYKHVLENKWILQKYRVKGGKITFVKYKIGEMSQKMWLKKKKVYLAVKTDFI